MVSDGFLVNNNVLPMEAPEAPEVATASAPSSASASNVGTAAADFEPSYDQLDIAENKDGSITLTWNQDGVQFAQVGGIGLCLTILLCGLMRSDT